MIIPSKEELITNNLLVQGARVLHILKSGATDVDEIRKLYPTNRNPATPSLERMFDILTYLYVTGFIFLDGSYVALKRNKASQ